MTELNKNLVNKKWERFSEWIHCICVVTFDLELGQAMEDIYPSHIKLSEQEKMNICYLAFPDSNSGCMGDTKFHIRLRVASANENTFLKAQHQQFNQNCIAVQRADTGHYWGFVYFRQIKDSSLPRGYFQKSIVMLSRLPFINLFDEISSILAPLYFDAGSPALEQACDNICNWPPLIAGNSITLQILGNVFHSHIPKLNNSTASKQQINLQIKNGVQIPSKVLSSVDEIDIYRSLFSILSHIHMLWELVLTSEPIVVMAPSPTDCSQMVQSLMSLITPLAYCAESRPYFSIHDSEFKEFTQRQQGPPPIILGVTNPFFSKTLQHWPHTIRLGSSSKFKKSSTFFNDTQPGVYTQYKSFLSKDKSIIQKIVLGVKTKRPGTVQTALLRRYLLELTQSFMIPLERYMASLMPLQKDISPFKAAPSPNQFKQDDFLATLEQSGPQLTSTSKGDWTGLYKKFFRSPNFKGWYETRYHELIQTLQSLQLKSLSEADLNNWVKGKHEVEIVDMILKLKQKLKICCEDADGQSTSAGLKKTTKDQLIKHLEDLTSSLPDDLKNIIDSSN